MIVNWVIAHVKTVIKLANGFTALCRTIAGSWPSRLITLVRPVKRHCQCVCSLRQYEKYADCSMSRLTLSAFDLQQSLFGFVNTNAAPIATQYVHYFFLSCHILLTIRFVCANAGSRVNAAVNCHRFWLISWSEWRAGSAAGFAPCDLCWVRFKWRCGVSPALFIKRRGDCFIAHL